MHTVGTFEAKTHLSELLDRVAGGDEVTITRHGKPIARLVPVTGATVASERRELVRLINEARRGVKLGRGLSLRRLIDEGRR